jgi:transposase InsO family protein
MTERRACRLANQPRGTQRYRAIRREDEDALTQAIIQLASQYGRYGYRRITALLKRAGWRVGKDRVERIWRREGLKVPQKQKPRGRLWLNDGSCVRLRPTHRNHVWSYDFVSARTHDGRSVRLLNLIDEHTRESLLVRAERRWSTARVISALADVMVMKGVPEHLRSDNGPEFVAKDLRKMDCRRTQRPTKSRLFRPLSTGLRIPGGAAPRPILCSSVQKPAFRCGACEGRNWGTRLGRDSLAQSRRSECAAQSVYRVAGAVGTEVGGH